MEEGLWLSVSEFAAQRGVAKQTLSERAARFEAQGLLRTKPGKGRAKLINVAEFDRAAGAATDVTRALNGGAKIDPPASRPDDKPADPTASEVLTRENARRAAYTADLARLEYEERIGKLLPAEDVIAATVKLGQTIVRQFDQLPSHADDLAAAIARNGAPGARDFLKKLAFKFREAVATQLSSLPLPHTASDDA